MHISMIAAMAHDRVIGLDNQMPWHLPADLRRFKQITMGKPMVMGRKTFESLPGPLPGRRHIVLTRDAAWTAKGAEVAHDLDAALALAGPGDVAVIGGAEVFALALPRATRIELTQIKAAVPGDTYMPELGEGWREIFRDERAAAGACPAFAFVTLRRDL